MKALVRICVVVISMVISGLCQEPGGLRQERDKLMEGGLWRDAVTLYREKLSPVSDENSGTDLEKAVSNLARLNEWKEYDGLIEDAVRSHPDNARVYQSAAKAYSEAVGAGRMVGGVFERGYSPDGSYVFSTSYRDRVRRLQLVLGSLQHAKEERVRIDGWLMLSSILREVESWKLQVLTPLDSLPAWEEPGPSGGTEGAPWAKDGPVIFAVPASWEAAKNDGERWRFALSELSKINETVSAQATLELARFSEGEFGSETLASLAWWGARDPEKQTGILALDTLMDDETLANTSDGVRRFKLPADYHFIALYRSIMDVPVSGEAAGFALTQVYLGRRQFVKARETLEQVIARHGPGTEDHRKHLLDQITGNWGRFGVAETVPEGRQPKLPLFFRNGSSLKLTARPVDMDAALADTIGYLKSNPIDLQWERVNPSAIASTIIADEKSKYLGGVEASWVQALEPAAGHGESRVDIEVPVVKSGAWWISGEMENGNSFHTLVWIVDNVLVQRDVAGAKQWWTADAGSGAPVAGTVIDFFGYRTINRERKNPQERRMDVVTKEFSKTTDEDGKVSLTAADMDPGFEWMAVAKKADRATAFFGFHPLTITSAAFENGNRDIGYGITDRPLYKPGDTVHVKFFLRNVGYFEPDEGKWASRGGHAFADERAGRGGVEDFRSEDG